MLGGIRLKVSFTHEKTCFAYINPKYSSSSQQTQCVQVLCKDKQVLLWAVFSNNISESKIACNPIYAKLIGLQEGLDVFVSPYADVKVLDELHVDADSPDDQEILEHNAELLQLRVLDQLRLVVANQKAVVWISTSLPIIFTPKQTGILVNHSQIIVKVDAFNSMQGLKSSPSETIEDIDSKFKNIGILNHGMLHKYLNVPEKYVFRALSIDSDGKRNLNHPYTVFVNECSLENFNEKTLLATIKVIPSILQDSDENDSENNNSLLNDLLVEVVPITNVIYRSLCREIHNQNIPTILIPKSFNALVNIENGSKIILTMIRDNIEIPDHIEIVTYSEQVQTENEVIEKFKHCVIEDTHAGKKFLINDGILHKNLQISQGYLQFKLKPEKFKYSLLNSDTFRHCTVSAKCLKDTDFDFPKPIVSNLDYDCKNYCRTLKSIESLVDNVLSHLYFEIHRDANFKNASEIKSNVLVTGLSGTGKTALCHTIQKELSVWSHLLHCRSLKGRKDIPEVLGKAILMCQEHSPAVLICDDVDALVPPNMEGASPQDIAYYQRLAVVIKHQLQSCSGVVVLMTSQSMKELHPTLSQFSGKPLFTAQFGMPDLEQMERVELFEHLLNDRIREEFSVDDDDVIKMAMDTTGSSIRDVTDYFHKRIFKAVKRKKKNPSSSNPRLVDEITTDSDRVNAFDIWSPVGGLEDVKRSLTECIFWPIMYPALFPSQSSGILLYGPPGTGKSHIGSCLARLTNMNLIAVKGPELLSKYIGQSEKAVRDIFDKADMKRPCILFFDEFDSLAPKRGHDSTGVTDRVVNQLLTRLDGAEGGARGPVVAASSRPDLIDPALLRPGRLHTHLYCGLPDQSGRYEVLRTLSKSVTVHEEVDLQALSVRTDGYSPADLKSLLVTAQLTRLEKQLGAHSEEKSMESVVVYQEDVESALLETKPSLSKEQKLFYDMIYRRFRGEPLTAEQKLVSSRTMEKQRVTLA